MILTNFDHETTTKKYIQTSLYYKGCKAFSTPSSQQLQVHKLLANLRFENDKIDFCILLITE